MLDKLTHYFLIVTYIMLRLVCAVSIEHDIRCSSLSLQHRGLQVRREGACTQESIVRAIFMSSDTIRLSYLSFHPGGSREQ